MLAIENAEIGGTLIALSIPGLKLFSEPASPRLMALTGLVDTAIRKARRADLEAVPMVTSQS
jgi:hypothetical protein